jgi:hypothetical protein
MKHNNIIVEKIVPTEQQSLEALQNLTETLSNMGQLRQSLTILQHSGFTLLPESRRLKIQPLYREREDDPHHTVPGLHLSGEWLKQAGFNHHRHARIISLHELLIICPEESSQPFGVLKTT